MSLINDNGIFIPEMVEENNLSNVIGKRVYNDPTLTDIHDVQTGIKFNKQILFVDELGILGKTKTGCEPSETTGLTFSDKKWEPILQDFRLTHCHADVNLQFKAVQNWSRVNPDYHRVDGGTNSVTGDYIVVSVSDAMPKSILVKAWFSDKLADTFTNGGNFTDTADLGLINSFDGLFKQIFTEIPTPNVAIAKNANATYALQELEIGDSMAIFKGLYKKADTRLRKSSDARFLVTSTLYMGLQDDLEDKQFLGGFTNITENGKQNLTYKGIPIVEMDIWDRYILELQNDGVKLYKPHRAVLTVKNNIPIGTPDTESLSALEVHYNQTTKKNYIDGEFGLDAKLLETYLTCVAY